MKKLVMFNLLLVAALVALPLGAVELYLRLTIPPSSNETIYTYTLDTKRYKLMKANAAVTAWGKELRTNRLGFRDRNAAIAPKQPGEFRIIVLGASFTVSAGVDYEAIYTSLLEKQLRQAFPDVKVINLAVGGYNIVQSALVLQEVGLGLEPDLVLVGITPEADFSLETYESNYRVAARQASALPPVPWYKTLYVYRAYGARLEGRIKRLFSGEPAGNQSLAAWEQNSAALKAIAALARERNIPLRAVLLPETWNFERQRASFARVEGQCASLDFACLNLLEPFIARGVAGASLRLNALDAHPNERYNALVAEELAADLAQFLAAKRGLVRTGDR
jgi:hypothetical protein